MSIQVTAKEAKSGLIDVMKAGLTPMITGSPGVGKSEIVHQIANEFNLEVRDLRLAQIEAVDIAGYPQIKDGRSQYCPMKFLPLEGDPVPEGKEGFLLFLDEVNHADPSTQKAAYQLILDKQVGANKLHPNTAIIAAGNLVTDQAFVEDMSTALQSRMVHFELRVDSDEWIDWAREQEIDHRIISYIQYKPDHLHSFNPQHNDKTFASPRTWDFLSRIIKSKPELSYENLAVIAGTVSEGIGAEFLGFTSVYEELPDFEDILKNPATVSIPNSPATQYALTGWLANKTNQDNVKDVMVYMKRLPPEFQAITVRGFKKMYPEVQQWITETAHDFYK